LRSFGARAARSSTVSFTYRQAVAVLTPNPAAISANVSPLRRQARTSRACCLGFSFQGRPDRGPVAADDARHAIEGLGGKRQRGTVESTEAPGGDEGRFGRLPHLPGASLSGGDTPHHYQTVTNPYSQDEKA
jgi:hypothetical protein